MAAFLPIAVLLSLLATGATAGGYGDGPASPSTPAPYTTPAAPYTPPPTTPAAHGGYDDDDEKQKKQNLVVVRVEGLVLCQSCAKKGSQSLEGAAPLRGAQVMVTCRDRKNRVMAYRRAVAGYGGYFQAEFGVQRADGYWAGDPRAACFVRLLSSPDPNCNGVTNVNGGLQGAPLRDEGKQWADDEGRGLRNVVFAAGPLAFRPGKCAPAYRY